LRAINILAIRFIIMFPEPTVEKNPNIKKYKPYVIFERLQMHVVLSPCCVQGSALKLYFPNAVRHFEEILKTFKHITIVSGVVCLVLASVCSALHCTFHCVWSCACWRRRVSAYICRGITFLFCNRCVRCYCRALSTRATIVAMNFALPLMTTAELAWFVCSDCLSFEFTMHIIFNTHTQSPMIKHASLIFKHSPCMMNAHILFDCTHSRQYVHGNKCITSSYTGFL
jgi:hypothetical protein